MTGWEFVGSLIVIGIAAKISWEVLKGLYKVLIKTFKIAGNLALSVAVGFVVLFISASVFDAAHAQAALQAGGTTLALTALAHSQLGA